ncbi:MULTISPECIES: transposase [unclassified Burkholderia]|uniref:transposase n=1 Tax=unclassified Burkholderia TaxID=2613784 RepID=UPI00211B60E1|nr:MULTISPECIES: transposase [unclassified Burkholderia]MDN7430084.1 transposase [Burkholderia sp. AU45388]
MTLSSRPGGHAVKKSRFTEEQIAYALKQAELGTPVAEVCRKMGISDATFYNWRTKYGGLSPSELRRLRERGIRPVIARRRTEHGSGLGKFRWVVERTHSWLHGFRRLRTRFERRSDIHEAFLKLACALVCRNIFSRTERSF